MKDFITFAKNNPLISFMKLVNFLYLTILVALLATCGSSDSPAPEPEGNTELNLGNIYSANTEWDMVTFSSSRIDSNVVASINSDAVDTAFFSYTRVDLTNQNDTTCREDDTFFINSNGTFDIEDNSSVCATTNYVDDISGLIERGSFNVNTNNQIEISGEDLRIITLNYGVISYSGIFNENDYLANFDFRSSNLVFDFVDSTATGLYRFRYTDDFAGVNLAIQEQASRRWIFDLHLQRR